MSSRKMPKEKKSLQIKKLFIGENSKNKKQITSLEATLIEQNLKIKQLQQKSLRKKQKICQFERELKYFEKNTSNSVAISSNIKKRRLKNPTTGATAPKAKQRRCAETLTICEAIHGGSSTNIEPAVDGMLHTLTSKCTSKWLAGKILNTKASVKTALKTKCISIHKKEFYSSIQNTLRSLNVYYSQDVLGKRKYTAIKKANKVPDVINFVPYLKLAKHIREIDIGEIHSISPIFTDGIFNEDIGEGMYRIVIPYVLVLAEFYLRRNEERVDELKTFSKFNKINKDSFLFLLAVGGDEAPLSGTSFLLSFLNIGKRIASSKENYLIFGANVKESSLVVKRYISYLVSQLAILEKNVYTLRINGQDVLVEFKVEGLPNDQKMLAYLGGELSNSAYYFTTFANVNQNDLNVYSHTFSLNGSSHWKPFKYATRLTDSIKVESKKKELSNSKTDRNKLTTFIGKQLNSRQEFKPLVNEYIDLAKCEPLHLKNNTVKELFMKIVKVVLLQAEIPVNVKCFNDLDSANIFVDFINFIKSEMNCNDLSKRLVTWFNENAGMCRDKAFGFRFRGKESKNYLQHFPSFITYLYDKINNSDYKTRLLQIFYQSLLLRKLVSYSVRIENVTDDDVAEMKLIGRKLFKSCCLFDKSLTPSMWIFCNVAPAHMEECYSKLNFGLGINTMEGREQKHQQILKYSKKSTFQERWAFIFRHEFIQLVYLRQNGFDTKKYNQRDYKYIPDVEDSSCSCNLKLVDDKCPVCDSIEMKKIQKTVDEKR